MQIENLEQLLNTVSAYRLSMIIIAAVKLEIFNHLSQKKRTVEELSSIVNVEPHRLEILLNALVVMNLIHKEREFYTNTEISNRYLVKGQEEYIGDVVLHNVRCWHLWTKLSDALKNGFTEDMKIIQNTERLHFIRAMDALSRTRAAIIADRIDLHGVKKLLDLGGGPGTYAMEFKKRYPHMEVAIFDLPEVIPITEEFLRARGFSGKINTIAGDFFEDEITSSYDLVWISQIIHSLSAEECRILFRKVYRALAAGGRAIVHDFLLRDDGLSPSHAVIFGVHMIAVTGKGKTYRFSEVEDMLKKEGFSQTQRHPHITPATSIIIAKK